jgi:hypothetical protein
MASSQFKIYKSQDIGGPGPILGITGSLTSLLDVCLVYGYGTGSYYKSPAGWTKPLGQTGSLAFYRPNSGSRMNLFINDMGPHTASLGKEAWATGWENIANFGCVTTDGIITGSVGCGWGQFPLPDQLLTTGHVTVRKCNNFTTARDWILFADAYTMYLFILSDDAAGEYNAFWFGDIYSIAGSDDAYRCMIRGAAAVNSATGDTIDVIGVVDGTAAMAGSFIARTFSGGGSSVSIRCHGDYAHVVSNAAGSSVDIAMYSAFLSTPNKVDQCYYISPLWLSEFGWTCMRGRFRGIYHICHATARFLDGQTFEGCDNYAGKSFQVVKVGKNGGMWGVEISNTVETN